MAADWSIRFWPRVGCHVFLSHAAEDRERLVLPVHERLKDEAIVPWLDRHDYPPGRPALEALRQEILKCRHVVYFVTSHVLDRGRGWCAAERTLADQMRCCLTFSGLEWQHVELPLLFVPRNDSRLARSVWGPLCERALCWGETTGRRETKIAWAARSIREFVANEAEWARNIGLRLDRDAASRDHFSREPQLLDRLRGSDLPDFGPPAS